MLHSSKISINQIIIFGLNGKQAERLKEEMAERQKRLLAFRTLSLQVPNNQNGEALNEVKLRNGEATETLKRRSHSNAVGTKTI